jgi:hypothetical protein
MKIIVVMKRTLLYSLLAYFQYLHLTVIKQPTANGIFLMKIMKRVMQNRIVLIWIMKIARQK